ncbi:MAG: NifB/NifX family molybdenum-iron cluster-binding protein [Anaerolineaceae bacterium]|nr:NifB/NifX family molybdenum-iron cluster-binding protein [Anaerolineaceae bacterium]
MKIAVITDDGKSISQHFGRAPFYVVITVEDGKIENRELRSKIGHDHFQNQSHGEENHSSQGEGHGKDALSHTKHVSMAETISDCKALICGGMGRGAYESMQRLNVQPVVTDLTDIDAAVHLFIDGKLVDRTELLH